MASTAARDPGGEGPIPARSGGTGQAPRTARSRILAARPHEILIFFILFLLLALCLLAAQAIEVGGDGGDNDDAGGAKARRRRRDLAGARRTPKGFERATNR